MKTLDPPFRLKKKTKKKLNFVLEFLIGRKDNLINTEVYRKITNTDIYIQKKIN